MGPGGAGPRGQSRGRAGADPDLPLQKERDLELAARIGQSLLKQNRSLTERNELLEEQLELAKEEVAAPGVLGGCSPHGRALMPLSHPRSHSCAMRFPCGTICSTSTPLQQRRASPPPAPLRREWGSLSQG